MTSNDHAPGDRAFRDSVVLITGAARGQGAAEATLFARAGARVVLADVLDEQGEQLARELGEQGLTARYHHLDVADEDQWGQVVADTVARWGTVNVLVNNAGVAMRVGLADTDPRDWDRIIAINLRGPFLGMRAVAPVMRRAGGGSIINTGSIAGMTGHLTVAYAASKWGLRGLAKSAARELAADGIRVNCVHPGILESPIVAGDDGFVNAMVGMTPMGRIGQADDVAQVVAFLASPAASFITGQDLAVDGGFIAGAAFNRVADDWSAWKHRRDVSAG